MKRCRTRIVKSFFLFATLSSCVLIAAGSAFSGESRTAQKFALISSAFQAGADIPRKYTCEAEDVSPPLRWENAPAATRTFALIADDPDAPGGTWVHWVIYDLPSETKELAEALAKTEALANGAKQGVKPRATKQEVLEAIKGHVLGEGELLGHYKR